MRSGSVVCYLHIIVVFQKHKRSKNDASANKPWHKAVKPEILKEIRQQETLQDKPN